MVKISEYVEAKKEIILCCIAGSADGALEAGDGSGAN